MRNISQMNVYTLKLNKNLNIKIEQKKSRFIYLYCRFGEHSVERKHGLFLNPMFCKHLSEKIYGKSRQTLALMYYPLFFYQGDIRTHKTKLSMVKNSFFL